jgi:hypothetical protein
MVRSTDCVNSWGQPRRYLLTGPRASDVRLTGPYNPDADRPGMTVQGISSQQGDEKMSKGMSMKKEHKKPKKKR